MSGKRPIAAFVLSLIGGLFILLGGLFEGTLFAFLGNFLPWLSGLAVVSYLVGILTLVFAILLLAAPGLKTAWGALLIIMAILSLPFSSLGGFLIGFILTLIGGILALTFKPTLAPMTPVPPMPPAMAPPPTNCPACGGAVNPQTRTCTSCGRAV